MKKIIALKLFVLFFIGTAIGQNIKTYPTHWWTGMKWNKVQVMVHHSGIGAETVTMKPYAGVKLLKVQKAESPNYLFIDLEINPAAKPGKIVFNGSKNLNQGFSFELKKRNAGNGVAFAQGVTAADFVYLVMPDRFVNADESNDAFQNLKDYKADRKHPNLRHGGDLQGVANKFDYLKDLGLTTIWMTPVLDNDMPVEVEAHGEIAGYHGYWITNHYQVDPRFGGNEAYKKLVNQAHAKGLKIIQDAVYNHIGIQHFLYQDSPFKDMINRWPGYVGSNHRDEAVFDGYANVKDKKVMLDGWFTPHLPDLNLGNSFMANFMIQNALWCTEEFGIDGWRVDTYKYCDEKFLNRVNDALINDFPKLTVFGEAWANTVIGSAYFARNNMNLPFKHNLQGVTDFPMQSGMLSAINGPAGWTEGVNKLYMVQSQDIVYKEPKNNCIFLDNHDMDRFYSMVGESFTKYKQGLALLLTLRGIPQMYYGTEVLMTNTGKQGDGWRRVDFAGGFKGDSLNKFTAAGRTPLENEAFNYLKTLANFRKKSAALTVGKTQQFIPVNGVYTYFRYTNGQTVMCVLNSSDKAATVDFSRFSERTTGFTKAVEIGSGKNINIQSNAEIEPGAIWVLDLKK